MKMYQQWATKNRCFQQGALQYVKGIMVHSTGANNPHLCRYVQPDDGRLGVNIYGNSFNTYQPGGRNVLVHAFIGELADGTIGTYQIAPWNMVCWHSGKGKYGAAYNMGYIGFEICEDDLCSTSYFRQTKLEAAELCAWLCEKYNLDPLADGVIINHYEGHQRGIASDHVDTSHWWSKFGYTMDDFRKEVKSLMGSKKAEEDEELTQEQFNKLAAGMDGSAVFAMLGKLDGEQLAALLARAEASLAREPEPMWSTADGWWQQAMADGVVTSNTPEAHIKRDEMVTILYRLLYKLGVVKKE